MRMIGILASTALVLIAAHPGRAAEPAIGLVSHEELGQALDDLAGQIRGLGDRWRGHFSDPAGERPAITIMLAHREELGLSSAQVQALERLRSEFQREAIKRDADLRVAEMDRATLLQADPVDLGKVDAKVREIERARGDLRLARIRAIEQGKAQLSQDQRVKLAALLADGPTSTGRPAPPRSQRF